MANAEQYLTSKYGQWKAVVSTYIFVTVFCATLITGCSTASLTGNDIGIAYRNGFWFDGQKFQRGDFYVKEKLLSFQPPRAVVETVDLAGGYVLPPFAEAHNHNIERPEAFARVNERYLAAGVFYVKNPNNIARFANQTRLLAGTPKTIDVSFSHGGLTSSDGHPIALYRAIAQRIASTNASQTNEVFVNHAYYTIDSEADLTQKWPLIMAARPDFLKTNLVHSEDYEKRRGNTTFDGRNGLSPALLALIVKRAHAAGLRVSTHVETAGDFDNAVAAGVDEINHLPGHLLQRDVPSHVYELTAASASAAARAGIVVVTTAQLGELYETRKPHQERAAEVQRKNLRTLHNAGVKVAIGSDNWTVDFNLKRCHGFNLKRGHPFVA